MFKNNNKKKNLFENSVSGWSTDDRSYRKQGHKQGDLGGN